MREDRGGVIPTAFTRRGWRRHGGWFLCLNSMACRGRQEKRRRHPRFIGGLWFGCWQDTPRTASGPGIKGGIKRIARLLAGPWTTRHGQVLGTGQIAGGTQFLMRFRKAHLDVGLEAVLEAKDIGEGAQADLEAATAIPDLVEVAEQASREWAGQVEVVGGIEALRVAPLVTLDERATQTGKGDFHRPGKFDASGKRVAIEGRDTSCRRHGGTFVDAHLFQDVEGEAQSFGRPGPFPVWSHQCRAVEGMFGLHRGTGKASQALFDQFVPPAGVGDPDHLCQPVAGEPDAPVRRQTLFGEKDQEGNVQVLFERTRQSQTLGTTHRPDLFVGLSVRGRPGADIAEFGALRPASQSERGIFLEVHLHDCRYCGPFGRVRGQRRLVPKHGNGGGGS